jgi:nucleotide-binding universal stress UspA family protein
VTVAPRSEPAVRTVPELTPGLPGPVVVGVDGTPRSIGALRWAAAEAAYRGVGLRAVHACEPEPSVAPYAPVHPVRPRPDEVVGAETEHLADLVRTALGDRPMVAVHQVCEPTSAIRALLAYGHGASMLVLATSVDLVTGTGLGSTALACVRNPPCPVVVLPEGSWP